MSWESEFLANLESINTALGGDPIVLPEPRSFQADSLLMLSAIALAAAGVGGGGNGQLLTTTKTDSFSTSSTSWVDVTGLSLTITPSSVSAKVRVHAVVKGGCSAVGFLRLVRDSTPIGAGPVSGSRTPSGTTDLYDYYGRSDKVMTWLDEPNTTSPVTYKVQAITPGGNTLRIGIMSDDTNSSSRPTLAQYLELREIL